MAARSAAIEEHRHLTGLVGQYVSEHRHGGWQSRGVCCYYRNMSQKKKIFIADDEASLVEAMVDYFHTMGYEAASALDGNAALAKIQAMKPDIVLLDILMPHKDGIEVLRTLKADAATAGIPVIMLPNVDTEARIAEALELGCAHYLVKSNYGLRDLVGKVREILEQRSAAQNKKI